MDNIIKGLYVSVWDDGFEVVSEATINLDTKEVTIGKHLYDYDFDVLDLEILDREYVEIDGDEYPCAHKNCQEDGYWYK